MRPPRYMIIEDGSTFHACWQCHNKDWLLAEPWSKKTYYKLLLRYKERYGIRVYSYCFMSNHPHLTGWVGQKENLSHFFRIVNAMFARAYNKRHGRRGQVVMDRFKSPRIETNADLLRVMIYNDLNPVRAKMTTNPRDYQWSSYHYYAFGRKDPLITPAPSYLEMGHDAETRQATYRRMIDEIVEMETTGGKVKREMYSQVHFIGNPEWVKRRHAELMGYMREKRLQQIGESQQTVFSPTG